MNNKLLEFILSLTEEEVDKVIAYLGIASSSLEDVQPRPQRQIEPI